MGGRAAPAYTGAGRKGRLRNELYECRGDTNWERLCLLSGKTAVSSLLRATRYQYMSYFVGEDILELGCQCGDSIAHMCKVVKRDGVSSRAIADEGRPQGAHLISDARVPTIADEGRPQGARLPIRLALERAPLLRQPHVGLSQFDAIALSSRGMEFRGVVQTIGQPLSESGFAGLLQDASHATEGISSTFIDRPLPFYRPTFHRCHRSG